MIVQQRSVTATKMFAPYVNYRIRRAFKSFVYNTISIKPKHSILLLGNHFSWWDGFLAGKLTNDYLKHNFHIMMQEDHLQKRMLLKYVGGFSINRKSKEIIRSLNYAAGLLDHPDNLVCVFPQGELVSNHTENITIERGISHIIKKIKGDCQIIYYTALIDYFESLKPSVYLHLADCGTNHNFNEERLKQQINTHHRQALKNQLNAAH